MTFLRVFTFLIVGIWVSTCSSHITPYKPTSSEIASVFSTVLEHKFAESSIEKITILNRSSHINDARYSGFLGDDFLERTSSDEQKRIFQEQFPGISDELLLEFLRVFGSEHRFGPELELKLSRPYSVISSPSSDDYSFVQFSGVAFDAHGKYAFVSLDHDCALLCGSGGHYLLEKNGNDWRVVKEFRGWRT